MLNIYVLEDHFIQQNRIEEVIHTILKKNNIKVGDFEVFDKPNQLLDFITERGSHQLFFLDIQIKDDTKKGLEVAKQIRKNDPYANIVFFTTHSEYLPLTFQYQLAVLDFIDKSLEGEDFQKRLESIILLTCKKIQSQSPEDLSELRMLRPLFRFLFMISCTLRRQILFIRLSFILKRNRLSFMAVSLKLKRVTLDCLNATNLSLSIQKISSN